MAADTWASLPCDLLIDIFRLLDTTAAVVRSAAACRLWRRAIISNASRLGPRPTLLLGFFHTFGYVHHRERGPFADVVAADRVDWTSYTTVFRGRACSP
ncbi:unnamed protein product [Urochloa humidicola]